MEAGRVGDRKFQNQGGVINDFKTGLFHYWTVTTFAGRGRQGEYAITWYDDTLLN